MIEEKIIYEQGNIKITDLRAIFGDKTYAMSNITSVDKGSKTPSGCAPGALIIGGVLFGFFAFTGSSMNWGLLVVAVIMIIIGVVSMRSEKKQYIVQIGSASGEIKAYASQSDEEIKNIVSAINEAIIQKG